ncbi:MULTISPECIES: hypothetical protein [unclassified Dolichospermum]|uniref:hypothetical protein n=1 Tax=unclassified Dolichospermum TaxID=2622029 RepID=UPI0014465805|nr:MULTISPECIES: hypothetical protein [unclassified Dolichospermum]MTJ16630.1 hypothetical protein [Dolichospermum sp. UHCC 0299]MTJ38865.1 hypothetical protein [Dolichospermum sp. UHCC 0406]
MSDYQDPVFAVNPANSSELPVPFIDTVFQAINETKYILSGLSSNSQRDYIMGTAFGLYNQESANQILTAWARNNFTNTPHIELVFGQNFNGAYAKDNNTIYLSGEFLGANKDNIEAVTGVLVEEVGHYLDSQINVQDAAGDEGDIFSRLVRGQSISEGELVSLHGEDDTATFTLNGQNIAVEMSKVAMEVFNNRIYQSVRGTDNGIYNRSSADGTNWTAWQNFGGATLGGPDLEVFNGRLYQTVRGTDNQIYNRSSDNGSNWTAWQNFGGATLSGPDLEVFNGRLYQTVRGTDNQIYNRSSDNGSNWTSWQNFGGATLADPELKVFNGKLFQAVQGTDDRIYTRDSFNGTNWNGWQERGGLTPADAPSGLMATSSYLTQLSNETLIGKYSRNVDNAYGYQCWDLVADATAISGSSPYWNAGTWKRRVSVIGNGNVAVGTAIATFAGTNNSYYGTYNHTGIFAGYRLNSAGAIDGFWMWEQNAPLGSAIGKGFYSISGSGVSDADNYYLVSV